MKTKLLFLILGTSALSLAAQIASQDMQILTTAKTNLETKTVIVTDTFTRNGQTNLIQQIKFQNSAMKGGTQKIYHDGFLLGTVFIEKDGNVLGLTTEPNPNYSLGFDFQSGSGKRLRSASIMDTNFTLIDGFDNTNGMLIPVEGSQIEKFNRFDSETAEFVKTNNRAGKSSKELGREVEDFIEKHKND
jgi:hypothetical protein